MQLLKKDGVNQDFLNASARRLHERRDGEMAMDFPGRSGEEMGHNEVHSKWIVSSGKVGHCLHFVGICHFYGRFTRG